MKEHGTIQVLIAEIQRITVKPDEMLYIKLPDLQPDEMKNVAWSLNEFFHGNRVKVIVGQYDLEFTAVKFEQLPEGEK